MCTPVDNEIRTFVAVWRGVLLQSGVHISIVLALSPETYRESRLENLLADVFVCVCVCVCVFESVCVYIRCKMQTGVSKYWKPCDAVLLQSVVAECCCSVLLQCVVAVCCCSVLLQCVTAVSG